MARLHNFRLTKVDRESVYHDSMSTALLILILHGLFLSLLIGLFGTERRMAHTVLSALVLCASLLLLEAWFNQSGFSQSQPHLKAVFQPVWFLIGPLAFIYTLLTLGNSWRQRYLLLLAPALLVAGLLLPFYLLPAADKLAIQARGQDVFVLYCGFWLLTGFCALRARMLIRSGMSNPAAEADVRPWHLPWLRALMSWMLIYALLDFSATAWFLVRGHYPGFIGLVSVLMLTAIIYGTGLLVVLPDGLLARSPWPGKRYQRSGLPDSAAESLVDSLEQMMIRDRPWLDENLRPAQVASRLGISTHQLSQLLNQHMSLGFHAYMNRFRVEQAQRLLRDLGSQRSMLDIGQEAGFGSNATFYRAFRKQTGMTPREFLSDAAYSNVVSSADNQSTKRHGES